MYACVQRRSDTKHGFLVGDTIYELIFILPLLRPGVFSRQKPTNSMWQVGKFRCKKLVLRSMEHHPVLSHWGEVSKRPGFL